MQRVSIIGLGLIGSSIGLGLRRWATNDGKRDAVLEISGFDLSLEVQNYAKRAKAVDRTEWQLVDAVQRADVIIIATPVGAVPDIFEVIAAHGKAGVVVTDTASTKAQVMRWAADMLPSTVNFVGGHPMAGNTRGVEGADADLFRGATWCVTPLVTASDDAVQTVLGIIAALGAEALFIDPQEHDGYVGGVSHLPFMLSAAMVLAVSRDTSWRDMRKLSASGFRDMSRLASGDPIMHRDICRTNGENVVRWLDATIGELERLREFVASGTDEAMGRLQTELEAARDARADWVTAEREGGEPVQDAGDELSSLSFGRQVNQLLFGGLLRRRPRALPSERETAEDEAARRMGR